MSLDIFQELVKIGLTACSSDRVSDPAWPATAIQFYAKTYEVDPNSFLDDSGRSIPTGFIAKMAVQYVGWLERYGGDIAHKPNWLLMKKR